MSTQCFADYYHTCLVSTYVFSLVSILRNLILMFWQTLDKDVYSIFAQ